MTNGNSSDQMMCDAIQKYFPGLAIPRVKQGDGPQHVAPMAEKRKRRSRDLLPFVVLPFERSLWTVKQFQEHSRIQELCMI